MVVAGVVIRLVLLPTDGLRGDIDQFVGWVHAVAVSGLATLYNGTPVGPVAFGPVMAYIWAVLAAVQPAFATVTDSADPGIRALMKLPASLADLGLAAIVVFALRDRPRWAVIGAAAILLHPAVIYVSAWWGQYESIFLLAGLGAVVAAINGRNGLAAVLVAAALMTKPQAVAFIVPLTAWFWASGYATAGVRGGVVALARAALIGVATLVVLWLPFLAAAGPIRYIEGLGMYQTDVFRILSLNAWNAWWLLQEAAGGHFLADDTAVLGPLAPRHLGYLATALLSAVVAVAIVRAPRAAGADPGGDRVGHGRVHVHDPDARALRLRGADHPGAAAVAPADPMVVAGVQRRVLPQPRRGRAAVTRDRGARAGRRPARGRRRAGHDRAVHLVGDPDATGEPGGPRGRARTRARAGARAQDPAQAFRAWPKPRGR